MTIRAAAVDMALGLEFVAEVRGETGGKDPQLARWAHIFEGIVVRRNT